MSEEGKQTEELELYSYWRSSCSWRVRIVLNLKELEYKYTPIHLVKAEQKSIEYESINASLMVPSLIIHNKDHHQTISQSGAIIEYLEEMYTNRVSILPKDPFQRAKARQLSLIIGADTQPVQNLRILQHVASKYGADEKMPWGKHWITEGFTALEKELVKHSTNGKFCLGDSLTIADVYLVPQVYNAKRFSVDMTLFPTITKIDEHLATIDAFIKAIPSNQPDAA